MSPIYPQIDKPLQPVIENKHLNHSKANDTISEFKDLNHFRSTFSSKRRQTKPASFAPVRLDQIKEYPNAEDKAIFLHKPIERNIESYQSNFGLNQISRKDSQVGIIAKHVFPLENATTNNSHQCPYALNENDIYPKK